MYPSRVKLMLPARYFLTNKVYILFCWAEYILEDGAKLTTETTFSEILYLTHPSSCKIRWLVFLTWLSGDPIFDALRKNQRIIYLLAEYCCLK